MALHGRVWGISPVGKGNSHDLNQRQPPHLTMEDLQHISVSESQPQWHNIQVVVGFQHEFTPADRKASQRIKLL